MIIPDDRLNYVENLLGGLAMNLPDRCCSGLYSYAVVVVGVMILSGL
jgi:hypothetical protein